MDIAFFDQNIVENIASCLNFNEIQIFKHSKRNIYEYLCDNWFWYNYYKRILHINGKISKNKNIRYNQELNYEKIILEKFVDRYKIINLLKLDYKILGLLHYDDSINKIIHRLDHIFNCKSVNRYKRCKICDEKMGCCSGNVCSYKCMLKNFKRKNLYSSIINKNRRITKGLFQYWINQSLI